MTMLDKRHKKVVVCVGLVVLLSSISCSPKPIRTPPNITGDPEAIEILQKMKENGKDLKSFIVETTACREREGKWEKVVTQKTIAKLPFKVKKEVHVLNNAFGFDVGEGVIVTDGQAVNTYLVKENRVIITTGSHLLEVESGISFSPANALSFLYRSLSFSYISEYFDMNVKVNLKLREKINGREACVLEVYPTHKRKPGWLKVWIDAEHYIPLRAQVYVKRSGSLFQDLTFKDYKLHEGKVWVFHKAEGMDTMLGLRDIKKLKRYEKVRITWTNLQINPDIPDSTFRFKTPKGAKVKRMKTR